MAPPRSKPLGDTTEWPRLSLEDDDEVSNAKTSQRAALSDDTAPSGVMPRADPLIGTSVKGFRIEGVLGRGASGIVYRAQHEKNRKRAALKVLKPELASDPEYIGRLIEEARALTALSHPGIVDIYDFGTLPNGVPYLAMELCEGLSLAERLELDGRLSLDEALRLLDELLAALEAAHAKGVTHRDLKPSNLFLANAGGPGKRRLKVLDFGLARRDEAQRDNETRPGTVLGTPDYMAPEQVSASAVGPFTDIYAVGGIAFLLLAGRLPFVDVNAFVMIHRKLTEVAPRMSDFEPRVPAELDGLVLQMLARNPADRPSLKKARAAFSAVRNARSGPVPSMGDDDDSSRPTAFYDAGAGQAPQRTTSGSHQKSTDVELAALRDSAPTLRGPRPQSEIGPSTADALAQLRGTPNWLMRVGVGLFVAGAGSVIAWFALRG